MSDGLHTWRAIVCLVGVRDLKPVHTLAVGDHLQGSVSYTRGKLVLDWRFTNLSAGIDYAIHHASTRWREAVRGLPGAQHYVCTDFRVLKV